MPRTDPVTDPDEKMLDILIRQFMEDFAPIRSSDRGYDFEVGLCRIIRCAMLAAQKPFLVNLTERFQTNFDITTLSDFVGGVTSRNSSPPPTRPPSKP